MRASGMRPATAAAKVLLPAPGRPASTMTPGRTGVQRRTVGPTSNARYGGPVPFAEVDGIRLHYADAGPRAEGAVARLAAPPALVLLHAFPLHSGMWTPQIEAFAAARRVIAPDLPGFGGSA